jgi:ribonucleoside-triphosphate reductase
MFLKLTKEQKDKKIKFIENYKRNQNPATASIVNANANVDVKNIATMEADIVADILLQVNRELVTRKIDEMF